MAFIATRSAYRLVLLFSLYALTKSTLASSPFNVLNVTTMGAYYNVHLLESGLHDRDESSESDIDDGDRYSNYYPSESALNYDGDVESNFYPSESGLIDGAGSANFFLTENGLNTAYYRYVHSKGNTVSCLKRHPPLKQTPYYLSYCDVAVKYEEVGVADDTTSYSCPCSTRGVIWCNCSSLALTSVPEDLPRNLEILTLENNNLTRIANGSFNNYPELKNLVLVRNRIQYLESDSFRGLTKLLKLDLFSNLLKSNEKIFPQGIFKHFQNSLLALRLNRNNPDLDNPWLDYPDQSLSVLKSLKFLAMDGLRRKSFGPGFEKMASLKTLYMVGFIGGYCKIESLYNDTFFYLPATLEVLNISNCYLQGRNIASDALLPLRQLKVLDLTWNFAIGLTALGRLLACLRESNVSEILATRVETRYSTGTVIYDDMVEVLPLNLTSLTIGSNSIIKIEPEVISRLPKTLIYLDASANRLVFGSYLQNLSSLANLETLLLNGDLLVYNTPSSYPWSSGSDEVWEDNLRGSLLQRESRTSLTLYLPPKLQVLSLDRAGLRYLVSGLHVDPNNSLKTLYLSYNYLPLLKGPLTGLNSLTHLYINNSNVYLLHETFFEDLVSLQHLDLSYNQIGFGKWSLQYSPFSKLGNLTFLDLTFNSIFKLGIDVFKGLVNLKELRLRGNTFWEFIPDISNLHHLSWLDLGKTSLQALSRETIRQIDSIPSIQVYLAYTPIKCGCDTIFFLKWLTTSTAVYRKSGHYYCEVDYYKKRGKWTWDDFDERIRLLERSCTSNYELFVGIMAATILVIAGSIGGIAYRFRWRLRYVYYAAQIHFGGDGRESTADTNHPYDVFLVYANDDEDFVVDIVAQELQRRGLRAFIHGRDFIAGEYIPANILMAVRKCRKTLVILTRNLLVSKWCRCEFQLAHEESVIIGRSILMILVKEKIPKTKLGLDLLRYIQTNTYLPYPDSSATNDQMALFWDKLVQDLRD